MSTLSLENAKVWMKSWKWKGDSCRRIPAGNGTVEEMPYGYTWPFFMRFAAAAMISMFAGAQCVHAFYKPLSVSYFAF